MPVVQMPDGAMVEMPESLAPEQRAALEAKLQESQGGVLRQLKLAGSSALQGAAGLPGLVMDAAASAYSPTQKLLASKVLPQEWRPDYAHKFGDTARGIQGGAQELFGVKPESSGEKFADQAIQGGVGGFSTGGAAPLRAAVAGGSAGAGGEIAARLFGDNPMTRILGALGGGGVGGAVANFAGGVRPQLRNLANQALEGIDPAQLKAAEAFAAKSAAEGVKIDLAQALEAVGTPPSNLTRIRDILANNQSGDKVQATLRRQPVDLKNLVDETVFKLPGDVRQPGDAANSVAEAATGAVNSAKAARSAAVRPLYAAAGDLSKNVNRDFFDAVVDAQTKPGATEGTVAALQKVLNKLQSAPSTQTSMTHALDYDSLISDLTGPFKGTPLSPADPKTAGQIKAIAGQLNQILQKASPELAQAESTFRNISRSTIDPLKQGPVGQLATKAGYKPDTQASVARLSTLFANGVDPTATGTSEILTLARKLKAENPAAFPDAVKTHLSKVMGDAFESSQGGMPGASEDAAERLWTNVFSKPRQMKGVQEMAAGIATSYGLPQADVVRGLNNLAQITKAVKSRPDSIGGLQSSEVTQLGGANSLSNLLRVFGIAPFATPARKLEAMQLARTFGKFDELLTSPEGAKTLAEIGKRRPMSPENWVLLSGFGQALPAAEESPGVMNP